MNLLVCLRDDHCVDWYFDGYDHLNSVTSDKILMLDDRDHDRIVYCCPYSFSNGYDTHVLRDIVLIHHDGSVHDRDCHQMYWTADGDVGAKV